MFFYIFSPGRELWHWRQGWWWGGQIFPTNHKNSQTNVSYDLFHTSWTFFKTNKKMFNKIFLPNPINALKMTIYNTNIPSIPRYISKNPKCSRKKEPCQTFKNEWFFFYYISNVHNSHFVYFVYFKYFVYFVPRQYMSACRLSLVACRLSMLSLSLSLLGEMEKGW